jgi:hypothetical protein
MKARQQKTRTNAESVWGRAECLGGVGYVGLGAY